MLQSLRKKKCEEIEKKWKKMKGMKGMKGIFLSFLWFLFIPQFIGTGSLMDWDNFWNSSNLSVYILLKNVYVHFFFSKDVKVVHFQKIIWFYHISKQIELDQCPWNFLFWKVGGQWFCSLVWRYEESHNIFWKKTAFIKVHGPLEQKKTLRKPFRKQQ